MSHLAKTHSEALEASNDHLLLKVASPVSGHQLTIADGACAGGGPPATIRDPITGSALKLGSNKAQVVTPVLTQKQVYSRKFYLTKKC